MQIAARHQQLQLALYIASREFEEAKGTDREFGALCRALKAGRELDAYEAKMEYLAELRAERARRQAAAATAPDRDTQRGDLRTTL